MEGSFGYYLKKYFFAGLITLTGIVLIVVGFSKNVEVDRHQTDYFLFGAFCVFIAGVVAILYAAEIITRYLQLGIMSILFVACIAMSYLSYKSLQATLKNQADLAQYEASVKQGLEDIRTIQVAYKKNYGKYADSFLEMKRFLYNDQTFTVNPTLPNGPIPDRQPKGWELDTLGYDPLNEEDLKKIQDGIDDAEAVKLGYLVLDTVYSPVYEELFVNIKEEDLEKRPYPFKIATLDVVPLSNKFWPEEQKFVYEYKTFDDSEESSVNSAFKVTDPKPYNPFMEGSEGKVALSLGNLIDGSTNGSWEE